MKTIILTSSRSDRMKGLVKVYPVKKNDLKLFEEALLKIWGNGCTFNKEGQLPMLRIYATGGTCPVNCFGVDELCGNKVCCKIGYDREEGIIALPDTFNETVLDVLNKKLDEVVLRLGS